MILWAILRGMIGELATFSDRNVHDLWKGAGCPGYKGGDGGSLP